MKASRYILLAANVLVWATFIWLGWKGMQSVADQHAPGYPNTGQFRYYLAFPAIVFVASVVPPLLLWRTRWASYGNGWLIITLLAVFPYACFYTGGM